MQISTNIAEEFLSKHRLLSHTELQHVSNFTTRFAFMEKISVIKYVIKFFNNTILEQVIYSYRFLFYHKNNNKT